MSGDLLHLWHIHKKASRQIPRARFSSNELSPHSLELPAEVLRPVLQDGVAFLRRVVAYLDESHGLCRPLHRHNALKELPNPYLEQSDAVCDWKQKVDWCSSIAAYDLRLATFDGEVVRQLGWKWDCRGYSGRWC